jgi:hypothetical protein
LKEGVDIIITSVVPRRLASYIYAFKIRDFKIQLQKLREVYYGTDGPLTALHMEHGKGVSVRRKHALQFVFKHGFPTLPRKAFSTCNISPAPRKNDEYFIELGTFMISSTLKY